MLKPRTILAAVLAAALLLAGGASAALAAPLTWQRVDVTLHQDRGQRVLLVSGHLPQDATLPAMVELAVPAGSELVWIGELLGGPPSEDPGLEPSVDRRGTIDVYSFQLTRSRDAQVEVSATDAVVSDGAAYGASLTWTPSQDVPRVTMKVLLPQGAVVVRPSEEATLQTGSAGALYYGREFDAVKAGQALSLEFAYAATPDTTAGAGASAGDPAASGAGAPGGDPSASGTPAPASPGDLAVPGLMLAGLLVAIVLVGRGAARKLRAKSAGPEPSSEGSDTSFETGEPSEVPEPSDDRTGLDSGYAGPRRGFGNQAKLGLVLGVVAVVSFVAVGLAAMNASAPTESGGVISKQYSTQAPCDTAVIPISLSEDADLAEAADRVFEILQDVEGVTAADVRREPPSIEVGFCESSTSEEAIRAAIAPTGLLASAP